MKKTNKFFMKLNKKNLKNNKIYYKILKFKKKIQRKLSKIY